MFTKTLALFLFPALATAQYGGGDGPVISLSSSSSASASASTTSTGLATAPTAPADTPGHVNIDVAFNGNFTFHPPNVTAAVGTLVTFYFPNLGLTHSVTQSTFGSPCTYLAANSSNSSAGFDSDLQSAATFTINITSTNPIWFFCKQVTHCGLGMVGSINARNDTNTYPEFLAAAKAIGAHEILTPNTTPNLGGGDGASATGLAVPDLTSTSSSSTSSPTSGALKITTSFGFALFAAVMAIINIA